MGDFLDQLQRVWPLVMEAPWGFAPLFAALVFASWMYGRFGFNERIALLRDRLETRDEKIEALEARLLEVGSQPLPPTAPALPTATLRPEITSTKVSDLIVEADKPLRNTLMEGRWTLHFSPGGTGGRKSISFLPDGTIGEGNNSNEYAWAVEGAKGEYLTIYRLDGTIQNVFYLSDKTGRLEYMPDSRARGLKNQFIEPRN